MKRLIGTTLALILVVPAIGARADDNDPKAIIDKAIKALGGEEKLEKAGVLSWKSKGSINFGGNEMAYKGHSISRGLDHFRRESEVQSDQGPRAMVMVIGGDKGWMKFGDDPREMEGEQVANWKQGFYLEVIPATLVPLKGKDFKLEAAGEAKVDGKPAVGVKAAGPDKKEFTLYFDKESGLPVKLVAKVKGFQGDELTQETTFKDYKDFGGIKKATKVDSKRDGEDFIKSEIIEFKVLDKVDDKTFAEPS